MATLAMFMFIAGACLGFAIGVWAADWIDEIDGRR